MRSWMSSMAPHIHFYGVFSTYFLQVGKFLHALDVHALHFSFPAKPQERDYSRILWILRIF